MHCCDSQLFCHVAAARICAHDVRLAVVPVAVASGGMLREFMIIILILIIVIITFSYQIKCFYNFLQFHSALCSDVSSS